MLISRIAEARVLSGYRLHLRYADGMEGVVDLTPVIAKGGAFSSLAGPSFATFQLSQNGRALSWIGADGEEVDFDADALRQKLVPQQAAAE